MIRYAQYSPTSKNLPDRLVVLHAMLSFACNSVHAEIYMQFTPMEKLLDLSDEPGEGVTRSQANLAGTQQAWVPRPFLLGVVGCRLCR